MLLVDAGDALFSDLPRQGRPPGADDARRAEQILTAMGRMGYQAMAVGERDLALGLPALKKLAAAAQVPLLASNLLTADGALAFEAGRLFEVGGVKVGVFAVLTGIEVERFGLRLTPAFEAAMKEAAALRKQGARLVVALLHAPYSKALLLGQALKGVDYAIHAHDGRDSATQTVASLLMTGAGERGRQLGVARFELAGPGPLFDRNDAATAVQQLVELDRAAGAQPEEVRRQLAPQRRAVMARVTGKPAKGQGAAATSFVTLGPQIPGDPSVLGLGSAGPKP